MDDDRIIQVAKHPPSHLDVESPQFEGLPHLWLQWKGTDVCCDIHCKCGAHLHFDGDFMYFFRCPHCGQVWESGTHVAIYPVDPATDPRKLEDHQIQLVEPDDSFNEG